MSKKLIWIVGLLSLLLVSKYIFADTSICRESLNRMVQSLNLDETQKSKIMPIISDFKSNMKSTGTQMDGIEDQMNQQIYSPNMDQTKLNDLVDRKTRLIGDMMKAKATATNKIYVILNDQQKQKFQSMITQAEQKISNAFKSCTED